MHDDGQKENQWIAAGENETIIREKPFFPLVTRKRKETLIIVYRNRTRWPCDERLLSLDFVHNSIDCNRYVFDFSNVIKKLLHRCADDDDDDDHVCLRRIAAL